MRWIVYSLLIINLGLLAYFLTTPGNTDGFTPNDANQG